MSHTKSGNILLHSIKEMCVSILKLAVTLAAYGCKGLGRILVSVGEFALKFVEK